MCHRMPYHSVNILRMYNLADLSISSSSSYQFILYAPTQGAGLESTMSIHACYTPESYRVEIKTPTNSSPASSLRRSNPFFRRFAFTESPPVGQSLAVLLRLAPVASSSTPSFPTASSAPVRVLASSGVTQRCVSIFKSKPLYPDSNNGATVPSQFPFFDSISQVSGNCHTALRDVALSIVDTRRRSQLSAVSRRNGSRRRTRS